MKHKNKEKPKYRSYCISFRKDGEIYRCSSSRILEEECCWASNAKDDREVSGGIVNSKTEEKAVEELKKKIAKLEIPEVGKINYNGTIKTYKEHWEDMRKK